MTAAIKLQTLSVAMLIFGGTPFAGTGQEDPKVGGYPAGVSVVRYRSAADESDQPALFWAPEPIESKPAPLLVALHTWSGDYRQAGGEAKYAEWCQKTGWVFIHPNFRGPNWTPEGLGSDLAVADIRSAVDFAKANAKVDEGRIYCVGVSGGGHASLLMAGRAPDLWAGVSAWCGISDIEAWHRQCSNSKFADYAGHIEKALGGAPGSSRKRETDAKHRSPVTWLENAGRAPLDINHGINDGRDGSVPFTHSLHAWNAAVAEGSRLDDESIESFYETRIPPFGNQNETTTADDISDPESLYGKRAPLFRRTLGNARVTIFDGGHEIIHDAALNWLAAQRKGRPANWYPPVIASLESADAKTRPGK